MIFMRLITAVLLATGLSMAAEFKVAALHPLLGDMARRIGGGHVEVVDLLKPNGNLHTFEPSSKDVAAAAGSRLILASGKNLEPYLDSLEDSFKNSTPPCSVLDLGAKIPDVPASEHHHDHEHEHGEDCTCSHGPNDPHWWQTPANMKRAARQLAAAYIRLDPAHAADYRKNLAEWNKNMDRLDSWARVELAKVPQDRRVLAIGHAAMNHFCNQYGFRELHVQGISREDESNPARLAATLAELRKSGLKAIFPEYAANPKSLEEIAKSLNIPLSKPLITDGLSPEATGFEAMFRYNVTTIVNGLTDSH